MRPDTHTRHLGSVELLVHGSVRSKQLTEALKRLIARTPALTGHLVIGYPPRTDAVLISAAGQVTAIDLDSQNPASNYRERQDAAFNELKRRLWLNVPLHTLTICAGVQPTDPRHPEYPLFNLQTAPAKLTALQQDPPTGIDPQAVIDQILWISCTAG